jgi:hypothetical protein
MLHDLVRSFFFWKRLAETILENVFAVTLKTVRQSCDEVSAPLQPFRGRLRMEFRASLYLSQQRSLPAQSPPGLDFTVGCRLLLRFGSRWVQLIYEFLLGLNLNHSFAPHITSNGLGQCSLLVAFANAVVHVETIVIPSLPAEGSCSEAHD